MVPHWLDGLTWWHVYPLGFSGAERDTGQVQGTVHRLRHVVEWLDYAQSLGCRGLQLGPVFASQSHGYDTTDHMRIDHRLGDEADFDALASACRARGMRLLLTGVFHYVGRTHPLFQAAAASGNAPGNGGAQAARWFQRTWPEDGGPPEYGTVEGRSGLVTLNHEEPEVASYVVQIMNHWLDRGADGWLLDSAHAVPPAFWRTVVEQVRQRHADAWLVGEVPIGEPAGFLEGSGLDGVAARALMEPLRRSLNEADLPRLAAQVDLLATHAPEHPPLTFVGTHDVTRLASSLTDQRHFGHAIAALFSLPGSPSVYYGDEQAFRGVCTTDDQEPVRPRFPEGPGSLAPWGWSIYHLHRRLVEMRSRHPWLTTSRPTVAEVAGSAIALRSLPEGREGRWLTALLNVADDPRRFSVDLPRPTVEVQSDDANGEPDIQVVPGHTWRVISHDPTE